MSKVPRGRSNKKPYVMIRSRRQDGMSAEHGSLYDPLHIKNKYRQDKLDIVIVEKDYHSGAKYIRQLEPKDGNTIDFLYQNSRGHVFYQKCLPEPRMKIYHNRETGKKVTTYQKNGGWGGPAAPQRVEWVRSEGRARKRGPHQKNRVGRQSILYLRDWRQKHLNNCKA